MPAEGLTGSPTSGSSPTTRSSGSSPSPSSAWRRGDPVHRGRAAAAPRPEKILAPDELRRRRRAAADGADHERPRPRPAARALAPPACGASTSRSTPSTGSGSPASRTATGCPTSSRACARPRMPGSPRSSSTPSCCAGSTTTRPCRCPVRPRARVRAAVHRADAARPAGRVEPRGMITAAEILDALGAELTLTPATRRRAAQRRRRPGWSPDGGAPAGWGSSRPSPGRSAATATAPG